MVEFRNRYVDLLVTPNHRMLVRRKSQGEGLQKKGRDWEWDWHVRRADEFLGRCTVDWRLPLTSTWTAPEGVPTRFTRALDAAGGRTGRGSTTAVDMPMWAFARFLGLYIAEGWLRHTPPGQHDRWEISVAQMAGGKLDEVRRILKDTGLNWTYHSSERSGKFTVGCKALWTYLEQCGRGAWNKVLPDEVMDWPAGLLEDLIYGLMTGDGTVNASGLRTYLTTSPRLADQVQEIWQKCGTYSSIAAKEPPASTFGKRTIYRVQSRREAEFQMPKPAEVPYDGNVYCVSVPNGIVLVRRNGKTMWCGNTDGNLPAAFAASPDTWSPDQIEQFQAYWDAMMYGDQSRKHQIRWMPPGSKFEWSNEKDFSDTFSLFLMRKTCASFHVVPSDIGFTENVNRSSGESQADVQHRVGDLPLMEHFEGILSQFLQDDLGLPLRHEFDRGEEQVDQAAQAEADQRYMDRAVVSASEIREMRYGLTDTTPVARVFFTERAGPIPLNSLEAVAGPVDAQTAAPEQGAALPRTAFLEAPGVQPNPPLYGQPLAEEIYGPTAIPPKTETASTLPVGKEAAEGGATAGITSETGLTSYDLIRGDDEPDEAEVAKEMAAFRRFERARRRSGEWRDFEFRAVDPVTGRGLNEAGRAEVIKAGGAAPKALGVNRDGPEARHWPGWDLDLKAVEHWAPLLAAALTAALTKAQAEKIARDWIAAHPAGQQDTQGRREAVAAAVAWLTAQGVNLTPAIAPLIPGMTADAHLIGGVSAAAVTGGTPPDLGGWQPGAEDKAGDRVEALGLAAGLSAALARAGQTAQQAADGYMTYLGRTLADGLADGLDAAGLADRLTGTLADLAGAGAAVLDVISAGIGMAARAWYRLTEVQQLNFITALDERVCPRCEQCEAGSPYSASDAPEIPQHPRCRCALVPADD